MSVRRVLVTAMLLGTILVTGPTRVLAGRPALSGSGLIHIGAVFPLTGPTGALARDELRGVEIARDLVNARGGVDGRRLTLDTRSLTVPTDSNAVMASFRTRGVTTVIGAYSSALSIPASQAASHDGMVYWEAGAVADRLTGRGLPTVFRVGASGSNLGTNSATFLARQLAPRLHQQPSTIRIAIVHADDDYAISVANAAMREAHARGMHVVSNAGYNAYAPDWSRVLASVKQAHPDVLILASHILDGVAFRRAMVAAQVHVKAFIGSTMAQCMPEFGALMGRDAIGVFASDRPPGGFNPAALNGSARLLYSQLSHAWRQRTGAALVSEEGLAGFTAAWALFHDVLPRAAQHGRLTTGSIAAAARSLNLPNGTLPNGAGLQFATDRPHLGQNVRAAAVIWQWQALRHSVVVWPSVYATGRIALVPLPR